MQTALKDVLAQQDVPYYQSTGNEQQLFESAWQQHLPLLLKGPTGCGKTRFV
ncbi:AAA family ATPase, partial [Thalassospira xiamenensis]